MHKMQEPSVISKHCKLVYLSSADFIVRSAYQIGKTPLLPLFAAGLGANTTFLGFIISASTLTGMLLKPLFGLLSDRWGRWIWFFFGTLLFSVVPFFYLWCRLPRSGARAPPLAASALPLSGCDSGGATQLCASLPPQPYSRSPSACACARRARRCGTGQRA